MKTYKFFETVKAICQFNYPLDYGYALLTQYPHETLIELHLKNLPPGFHGFHIHEFADKRNGCDSMGPHYNPYNGTHLDINQYGNHLGDLGNIYVDQNGICEQILHVNHLPLTGKFQVIGRGMVIHEKKDDLGLGGNLESSKTGNSGSRIACGIIGYTK